MTTEYTTTCDVCGEEIENANVIGPGQPWEVRIETGYGGDRDTLDLHPACGRPLVQSIRRKLAELQREKEGAAA